MLISQYVVDYTDGSYITFREVLQEVKEFWVEVFHLNRKGMKEEWQDVMHFFQIWLYWRFRIDGEIWQCTMGSVNKFMGRLAIWRKLYEHVGLDPHVSNFGGNYARLPKVIKQLGKFGISESKAIQAYNAIVLSQV